MRVAVGLRAHTGWAAAIVVGENRFVARARVDLVDDAESKLHGLFHRAAEMDERRAESFVAAAREDARGRAKAWLARTNAALDGDDHELVACGLVLSGSKKPLPPLEAILKSHPLVHTAEGAFYRDVLADAARELAIPVLGVAQADLRERAVAARVADAPAKLDSLLAEMGRAAGKPWQADQKEAALVALLALAPR